MSFNNTEGNGLLIERAGHRYSGKSPLLEFFTNNVTMGEDVREMESA
jgi:hypothetical protein